jgi:DNA-binding LacI/PurR family transcriptional regulator
MARSLFSVSYFVRGTGSQQKTNIVAANERDAVAALGQVDSVSVQTLASDVLVVGQDTIPRYVYPPPPPIVVVPNTTDQKLAALQAQLDAISKRLPKEQV